MEVCVLSGSPKGENSITYQTVRFLEKKFGQCHFNTLHVGQKIRMFEKDFSQAKSALEKADMILFCYPVYTFIAPAQLHRFIELMKEENVSVSGKWAIQLTTSKHFYDTTAHKYIEENCADMGLKYLGGFSADMDDLLKEKGRKEAVDFFKLVLFKTENTVFSSEPEKEDSDFVPYSFDSGYKPLENVNKNNEKNIVIVAALEKGDIALAKMIDDFRAVSTYPAKLVNICEYPFSGGCLGCFHCAATGKCIYKDGFDEFLRNEIQTGSAIVYAFTIKDHSMGSRMKMYDDRQFCNGHRTVTMGMPFGYLVNGDLSKEPNLSLIIDGRAQVGGNFLAGVALDQEGIINMSKTLEYAIRERVELPAMFLGVGGMKIFRDLIWIMQGMMKEDHRFYKKHGFYDFPQKQKGTILKMKLVGMLISNPKIQAKMGNRMTEGMLMPYNKVLDK